MPGFPHPEVEVRCVHARDVHPILPGYCVQDGVQTVDAPFPYTRISEGPRDVHTVQRLVESQYFRSNSSLSFALGGLYLSNQQSDTRDIWITVSKDKDAQ